MRKRRSFAHIGLMGADRLIAMDFCDACPEGLSAPGESAFMTLPEPTLISRLSTDGSIAFFADGACGWSPRRSTGDPVPEPTA
jgi:hypothetical protein